jgi:hypothetical protein
MRLGRAGASGSQAGPGAAEQGGGGPFSNTGPRPAAKRTGAEAYAPHPACSPPTRSATIFSAHPDRA